MSFSSFRPSQSCFSFGLNQHKYEDESKIWTESKIVVEKQTHRPEISDRVQAFNRRFPFTLRLLQLLGLPSKNTKFPLQNRKYSTNQLVSAYFIFYLHIICGCANCKAPLFFIISSNTNLMKFEARAQMRVHTHQHTSCDKLRFLSFW